MLLFSSLAALVVGRITEVGTGFSSEWKEVGKSDDLEQVKLLLVLKRDPASLEKLEKLFWEVSDPDHEKYGEYLSQDDVTELMAIGEDQLSAVKLYLEKHGADLEVGAHKDLVHATVQAGPASKMFSTEFHMYQHKRTGKTIHRAKMGSTVSIPMELQEHIDYVDSLTNFPRIPKSVTVDLEALKSKAAEATETNVFPQSVGCPRVNANLCVTPGVLQMRYKTNGPLTANETKGSTMSVAEFADQYYSQTNQLDKFNYYCEQNATVDTQVGNNDPSVCDEDEGQCTESQLDIEYIRAVGGEIPLTDVYTQDYSLLSWAKTISDMQNPPLVNSVSYGNDEAQNYYTYMQSCNTEFQKLAVRGISVLFASGDQGVWGRLGVGSQFHPDFPAASPYVTAVGGTDFATAGVIGEEKAWNNGGGGFSDTFNIPSYQADAVSKYKQMNGLPYTGYWNTNNGRGYPDVAALAGTQNPYLVYSSGKFEGVGGTSAACPVFSAIIAQLNSIRLSTGGKPLGFLNPWLYKNPSMFNDVTLGNNGGARDGSGFPAVTGWDAATGLGTPNFELMKAAL